MLIGGSAQVLLQGVQVLGEGSRRVEHQPLALPRPVAGADALDLGPVDLVLAGYAALAALEAAPVQCLVRADALDGTERRAVAGRFDLVLREERAAEEARGVLGERRLAGSGEARDDDQHGA